MFVSRSLRQVKTTSVVSVAQIAIKRFSTVSSRGQALWQPQVEEADFPNFEYDAFVIAMKMKRKLADEQWRRKLRSKPLPSRNAIEGSSEEILEIEVADLLARRRSQEGDQPEEPVDVPEPALVKHSLYELDIVMLSSTGDGLAYNQSGNHIVVVPFTVPGDTVFAKVYKTIGNYSLSDFVSVVKPSPMREGITPQCKYFSACGGCQLQMISYEDQLKHKKTIVEKAFRFFSGLPADMIPPVLDTMGSPLQYGYRTKLSPHFQLPRRRHESDGPESSQSQREDPKIGFNRKGWQRPMDIEQCPIGTDILNEGLSVERAKTISRLDTFKRGATLLLRESTVRQPRREDLGTNDDTDADDLTSCDFDAPPVSSDLTKLSDGSPQVKITYPTYIDRKTYVSDMAGLATEYIGHYKFVNRAGAFFQNNNSILRPFTSYVRDQVLPPADQTTSTGESQKEIKYLLDAYCGSGLFTITLSPHFSSALGIDIDRQGIEAARLNAEANNIPNAGFIDADAANLFADVPYPPDQSLVVIDPPRRGASEDFLRQLCKFGAKRVIYISCNVHTQARDVGMIVKGFEDLEGGCRYEIESLKGFDFFPQTGHVEGCCVLNRVDD